MAIKEKNEVTVVLKSDGATRRRIFSAGMTFGFGLAALAVYALAKWDEYKRSSKCDGHWHCKGTEAFKNPFDDLEEFEDEGYFEEFEDEDDIWDDTEVFEPPVFEEE